MSQVIVNRSLAARKTEVQTAEYSSGLPSTRGRYTLTQWVYYITNITCTYNPSTVPWGVNKQTYEICHSLFF